MVAPGLILTCLLLTLVISGAQDISALNSATSSAEEWTLASYGLVAERKSELKAMSIPEDKKVSGVILAKTREHVISLEGSYSLHLMAKDFDGNIRTTTFLPSDDHACCVMTVTVSFQVKTVWSYRNSDAFGWDYYGEASSNITGTHDVCQYLLVNGNPNLPVYPRGWKVEIYLDGVHEADEYFEITSDGRYIETSQNVISTQTSMYSYIALWSVAYFNNRTGHCHDYLERWYKPDGSLYAEATGGWPDYKSPANPERDYWSAVSRMSTRFFYGGITIGVWRIEVYLDQYYDGGWEWIHIATCPITVRPPGMSPIAILSASPTEVQVHETVTLNGSASYDPDGGTISSYLYDFGDGSNSSWTSQPVYYWEYTAPGDYSVKLKVKDDEGDVSSWSNITYIHARACTTQLQFTLNQNPAYVGQTITLLGNLIDMLGHPVNNAKVDVFLNETSKGSLFTNSSGWFKASAKVDTPGTYVIKVAYSGSATYKPSNHTETLKAYPKIDTKVSFTLSPNPATVGQTVTMLGNLTDINNNPIGNAPLELYTKKGMGSWQYAGTISTNSSGWFKPTGKITSFGTYQVKVLYKGSYKYNQSYRIETLTVNPSMASEIASTEAHWLKTG